MMKEMGNIKFNLPESLQRLELIFSSNPQVSDQKTIFPSLSELPVSSLTRVTATVVCVKFDIDTAGDIELKDRYRCAAISEFSCILGQEIQMRDVFVWGNMIFAIYETPLKSHLKSIINATARINAFKGVINAKYGGECLKILVTVSFDNLDIQVLPNFRQNLVWGGNALDNVIKMAEDHKNECGVIIGSTVYDNLDEEDKAFFIEKGDCYLSNFKNSVIHNWVEQYENSKRGV